MLIPIDGVRLKLRFLTSGNRSHQRNKLVGDRRSDAGWLSIAETQLQHESGRALLPTLRSAIYYLSPPGRA
jgi:hypothetical protein